MELGKKDKLESALDELGEIKRLLASAEKRKPLRMPDGIQRAIRQVIRKLGEDEEKPLVLDFQKFENNDVKTIVREVRRAYKDYDWGAGTIEEGVKRVWRNMRDDHKRKEKGKMEEHRKKSKTSKRKRDKLKARLIQLERDTVYTTREKQTIRRTMTTETMSPEVTDEEDESRRVSIPFVWESTRLTEVKRILDSEYKDTLSGQSRRQKATVLKSTTEVTRTQPPRDIPGWAVSDSHKE